MTDQIDYKENKIVVTLICCGFMFVLSFLVPVMAYVIPIRPAGEPIELWFQRSGSISVFIVLFSEYLLFSINNLLYPIGRWDSHEWPMKLKYGKAHSILIFLSFIAAIWGTAIWGYGDLFVSNL